MAVSTARTVEEENLPHQAELADDLLVEQAKRSPTEFAQLYLKYEDPILKYCFLRLGNWEEAEDASQHIFANAFSRLNQFDDQSSRPGGSFRSWIFTIAHHEVLNRWRQASRWASVSLDLGYELAGTGPTPDESVIAADQRSQLRELIGQLSEDQRRVIELRLAGLTDREIAEVLDRSPGAIRVLQSRAVAKLRLLTVGGPANRGKRNG